MQRLLEGKKGKRSIKVEAQSRSFMCEISVHFGIFLYQNCSILHHHSFKGIIFYQEHIGKKSGESFSARSQEE